MQPVKEQSASDTDHAADHGTEGQPPASFWRSLTGLPDPANHVAPPSIMQIRISALLEEQAEALLKELRDKAIARMSVAAPSSPEAETEAASPTATATAPPQTGEPPAAVGAGRPDAPEQDVPAPLRADAAIPGLPDASRPAGPREDEDVPRAEPQPATSQVHGDRTDFAAPALAPALGLAEHGYGTDSEAKTLAGMRPGKS
ncbi:hypothetical protein [Salipiger mangrovisoli]|uniref:Uncharacterized protein n=1 Tax=Salipiger mangrovisoli TaxID=2865933 RepID=A0ABR9X719_9RHOB|nr:hypothetical protein [Salipiger mangrovisoli]MBE9639405.1 hypothetical protein [Salipiger mangrovisoli]